LRKLQCVTSGPDQGHRLVLRFFIFGLWITVIDNAGACLDVEFTATN